MPPLRRNPLSGQATQAMMELITGGQWPLGRKIPSETALAAEFGIGRSTVREALRELAVRGLLEARQGSGVFVVGTEPVEEWSLVVRRAEITEVVEGRIAVETEAARLAAAKRTADDMRAIEAANGARQAAGDGSAEAFVDADIAFHRAVVDAARNSVITGLFVSLTPRVREAMLDVVAVVEDSGEPRPVDRTEHQAIVDAIGDGDADRAARVTREHLGKVLGYLDNPQ
ncbi:DNA-binding FadR family transcriptional regulator [Saccharopolyspora erythraea NRRL 2338]|uniref:Transcriptional regulator, GntR family n=2 Tax=Saccharopolyspora erythraea TaxID=1836 RepID=A4FLG8_SACEN|nr:FadR/GntR family transcriptional regulator [Saccharopolyspora erythraea]EQD85292.1 GntR family transcriptional regulator [Saccharopolyspora erythraea D]PFG98535.1 DNA-binding FadR family transcriptional regulator [Saccharopolyspora erythraea NRRL 2338]QRK88580.1 FadR family transcriptional regulator [Saccharopolyspora erythraea]CAM04893.1 transcriptional regulator, GntR family [Saccharopolyspora erythraea NRRL 2338]